MALAPTLGSIACRSLICHSSGLSLRKALLFNGIDLILAPILEKTIHNITTEKENEKKVRIWVVIVSRAISVTAAWAITHVSLGPMNLMTGIALDVSGYIVGYLLIVHYVPPGTTFCIII